MRLVKLSMGCFSSRSTIAPTENNENDVTTSVNIKTTANGHANDMKSIRNNPAVKIRDDDPDGAKLSNKSGQNKGRTDSLNSSTEMPDDDIMSILISSQDKSSEQDNMQPNKSGDESRPTWRDELEGSRQEGETQSSNIQVKEKSAGSIVKSNGGSFDEEPNLELLRKYVAVDYEIAQLEDKDALRVYHEKIEQLEQLERELDMIGSEAEEVAVRNESNSVQLESSGGIEGAQIIDSKVEGENNSTVSEVTGSMSRKSWLADTANADQASKGTNKSLNSKIGKQTTVNNSTSIRKTKDAYSGSLADTANSGQQMSVRRSRHFYNNENNNNQPYSTIEEVFNRKIILEKERDKLKKEVELVIVECDKLQQRYKKRDEILDKLFDGRTGGGLENHLEQQLNWLLEQKHYVDQVFYAWKRAETLTSQTCEQFASALELLKRLPKVEEPEQRIELLKSIGQLCIKSRQDMEQAQKYNPNVDAPFFTDNETERFDRIIELITSSSNPTSASTTSTSASNDNGSILISTNNSTISPTAYSQILTVLQFAYKRAVSIRQWLEQILQTTIARDTFELAEEYKWIAIQLRKERINLIKIKLQETAYQPMVQSIRDQMEHQLSLADSRRQHEINRDSGVESETNDVDIEEEIYRLLELNKWRLDAAGAPNGQANSKSMLSASDRTRNNAELNNSADLSLVPGGGQVNPLTAKQSTMAPIDRIAPSVNSDLANVSKTSSLYSLTMPTKLKIELDEEMRQSLLKQVDQIHIQHKSKLQRLRGNNKALAANSTPSNRKQNVGRQTESQQAQAGNEKGSSSKGLAAN